MKYINQRESPRIDIRLQCQVSSPGLCRKHRMVTENISRSGLLLVWAPEPEGVRLPEVGRVVTVDVELPSSHGFGRKCIHCQAVVVRITKLENDLPRVALSINYMKFRAYRENIAPLENFDTAGIGTWVS
jgi:c-di-GMP-binding flagellar brake protein YcgR